MTSINSYKKKLIEVAIPLEAISDAELAECREGLLGLIHSLGLEAHALRPSALIGLVDELTSPTTAREPEPNHWNPLEQIDVQAIRRDIELEVEDDRLVLRTERFREVGRDASGNPEVGVCLPDSFDLRHYAVRSFPERWAPWECARLIGDMFTDKLPSLGQSHVRAFF